VKGIIDVSCPMYPEKVLQSKFEVYILDGKYNLVKWENNEKIIK